MKCPRDASTLQFQGYWKHPRHVCGTCKGQLLSERDIMESMGHAASSTFGTVARIRLDELPASPLLCPRDGKAMRVNNGSLDVGIERVLDFVGEAVGSVFDGLL